MGVGWRAGANFHEFEFFCEFHEMCKFRILRSLRDWLCNRSLGGEKYCILYRLFGIFFIIVIVINISFVVLLSCLYLNPRVLLFPLFSSHATGVAEGE